MNNCCFSLFQRRKPLVMYSGNKRNVHFPRGSGRNSANARYPSNRDVALLEKKVYYNSPRGEGNPVSGFRFPEMEPLPNRKRIAQTINSGESLNEHIAQVTKNIFYIYI